MTPVTGSVIIFALKKRECIKPNLYHRIFILICILLLLKIIIHKFWGHKRSIFFHPLLNFVPHPCTQPDASFLPPHFWLLVSCVVKLAPDYESFPAQTFLIQALKFLGFSTCVA